MRFTRPKWPDIATPLPGAPQAPLHVRLLWMVAIWAVSILGLLVVAEVLRLVLR